MVLEQRADNASHGSIRANVFETATLPARHNAQGNGRWGKRFLTLHARVRSLRLGWCLCAREAHYITGADGSVPQRLTLHARVRSRGYQLRLVWCLCAREAHYITGAALLAGRATRDPSYRARTRRAPTTR
jgi:hypothetical protein